MRAGTWRAAARGHHPAAGVARVPAAVGRDHAVLGRQCDDRLRRHAPGLRPHPLLLAVGAIGVAQMVPTLIVGLLGGPVADAMDRRKLVLVTSRCLALVSAALAVQAFAGLGLLWLLYALVAVQSSLSAVDRPARQTFVPPCCRPASCPPGWR